MGREWWWILGAYSPELSTAALYVWSGVTCGVTFIKIWNQPELGVPNQMSLTAYGWLLFVMPVASLGL